MPTVFIPTLLQNVTGGHSSVEVEGATVGQVIDNLEQSWPGVRDRLIEAGRLRPNISVAVDGELTPMGLLEAVGPASEVHFVAAIKGGVRLRVAVIYGGRSGEHEISLRSAKSIMDALDRSKYEVLPYFIDKNGKWSPRPIPPEPGGASAIDVVFPVLHGTFGEDGTMQGLLELADLPYVGPGVLASAVSMDKEVMKRLCVERGLPVVEYVTLMRGSRDVERVCAALSFPLFVKPANLGSSVGITKVRSCAELPAAMETAAQFDNKIIVERGIVGREFECAVLGNEEPRASAPCEVLPSREFYDYEDKYLLDQAQFKLPADLPPDQIAEIQRLAVECYRAVEGEGMSRVDFLLETATGKLFINEINTIPGFTSISMYPKMWEHAGLPFPQLLDELIRLALDRHVRKKATRFAR